MTIDQLQPLTAVNQRSSPAVVTSADRDNRLLAERRKDDVDHLTTDVAALPSNRTASDGGKVRTAQFDRSGNPQPSAAAAAATDLPDIGLISAAERPLQRQAAAGATVTPATKDDAGDHGRDVHQLKILKSSTAATTSQSRLALPLDTSTRTSLLIQRLVGGGGGSSSSDNVPTVMTPSPSSVSILEGGNERRPPSFATQPNTSTTSTAVVSHPPPRCQSDVVRTPTTTPLLPLDAGRWFPTASFDFKSKSTTSIGGSCMWRFPAIARPPTGSTVAAAPISIGGGRPARFPRMGQSCLSVATDCGSHRVSQRSSGGTVSVATGRRLETGARLSDADGSSTTAGRRAPDMPSSRVRSSIGAPGPPYYCVGDHLTTAGRSQFYV